MRMTKITVHGGRTFNHPTEPYANFRPGLSVEAEILEGENWEEKATQLQTRVEVFLDAHKERILKQLVAENIEDISCDLAEHE